MGDSVICLSEVKEHGINLAVIVQDFGPVVDNRGKLGFTRQTALKVMLMLSQL